MADTTLNPTVPLKETDQVHRRRRVLGLRFALAVAALVLPATCIIFALAVAQLTESANQRLEAIKAAERQHAQHSMRIARILGGFSDLIHREGAELESVRSALSGEAASLRKFLANRKEAESVIDEIEKPDPTLEITYEDRLLDRISLVLEFAKRKGTGQIDKEGRGGVVNSAATFTDGSEFRRLSDDGNTLMQVFHDRNQQNLLAAQSDYNQLKIFTMAFLLSVALASFSFFIFLRQRITNGVLGVLSSLLRYSCGDFRRVAYAYPNDEFGQIQVQLDGCAKNLLLRTTEIRAGREKAIAELKTQGESLERMNESLRTTGRAFTRFLTDVSHDLKTPLTIMLGECQVLMRIESTNVSEYRETLRRIIDQARYLTDLVDQLLYVARSKSTAATIRPEVFDLRQLVAQACNDMSNVAAGKDVRLEFTADSQPVMFEGDRIRIREVVLAVLDNAVSYTGKDGEIGVSLEAGSEELMIVFQDTGIGIPASEMPNVFRRFYRGSNAMKANATGTGLGLAIAVAIVEGHGGQLELKSAEDEGTTVTISLPANMNKKPAA